MRLEFFAGGSYGVTVMVVSTILSGISRFLTFTEALVFNESLVEPFQRFWNSCNSCVCVFNILLNPDYYEACFVDPDVALRTIVQSLQIGVARLCSGVSWIIVRRALEANY